MTSRSALACLVVAASLFGCGVDDGESGDVKVKTETALEWAQYTANVAFARSYVAQCKPIGSHPRVLVTGYGRFMSNETNASGEIVSALVPGLSYPQTLPPEPGQVDDPAPQTAVALGTITLPNMGDVDVCGMVLPVSWDLAAILALKEIDSFQPDMVVMDGIAGDTQPIWIELGSVNRAMAATDGSGTLAAIKEGTPLVKGLPEEETLRGNHLSWLTVRAAADAAIASHKADVADGQTFGDVLTGTAFGGFPRQSNTYLCNNLTYVVNYLIDHPNHSVKLLEPSHRKKGAPTGVSVRLKHDMSEIPRVFVHWPSSLRGDNLASASTVMAAMIDAQLGAVYGGEDLPTDGDNALADVPADE